MTTIHSTRFGWRHRWHRRTQPCQRSHARLHVDVIVEITRNPFFDQHVNQARLACVTERSMTSPLMIVLPSIGQAIRESTSSRWPVLSVDSCLFPHAGPPPAGWLCRCGHGRQRRPQFVGAERLPEASGDGRRAERRPITRLSNTGAHGANAICVTYFAGPVRGCGPRSP